MTTTAAKMIGTITEFDPAVETIGAYLERLEMFFIVNTVANDKKVAMLGTLLGAKNYSLLRSLVAPDNPKDKTYDELVEKLRSHFEPKPLVIAERFNFYRRVQATGETVADFVAALRQLSAKCEFGTFLDQAIRDKFVCGLRSEAIQRKLLTEDGLTTARAVEIAQGMESATTKVREIKESASAQVNKVSNHRVRRNTSEGGATPAKTPNRTQQACYHCGRNSMQLRTVISRQPSATSAARLGISLLCAVPRGLEGSPGLPIHSIWENQPRSLRTWHCSPLENLRQIQFGWKCRPMVNG